MCIGGVCSWVLLYMFIFYWQVVVHGHTMATEFVWGIGSAYETWCCTRIKCSTDQTKRGMKLSIVKLSFVYCFIVLRLMCCFGNSALKRPIVNSLRALLMSLNYVGWGLKLVAIQSASQAGWTHHDIWHISFRSCPTIASWPPLLL
jgi:hypothetical protein